MFISEVIILDTFFSDQALLDKLLSVYREHKKIIIAYDFDDTIAPTYMASDCSEVMLLLKQMRPYADFICFTSNTNTQKVLGYIQKHNIPCDYLNENTDYMVQKYGPVRKVYFNILLDDKAGLGQAYRVLQNFYTLITT